jgi:ABC-2 type transport system ATP-binding protein
MSDNVDAAGNVTTPDPSSHAVEQASAETYSAAEFDGAVVEIDNVTKTFGDKTALQDVSWAVRRGRICGLLGPNGAGKTTLFRLLMGILKPTTGSLRINGLDCFEDRVRVKRLVGFLPDEPAFYSYLSGREVLELSASMHGLNGRATVDRLQPLIDRMRMSEAMPQFADDYSRGMKKKLGILLALLHDPILLILDEPTNGLDVESTQFFFELIREETTRGRTVLFSTHLMDQVERLCQDAAIINDGRLVASGTLDDLRQQFGADRRLEEIFLTLTRKEGE